MDNLISLDCETTGLNTRQDIVIGFSWDDGTGAKYIVHKYWNGEELVEETLFETCVEILKTFHGKNICGYNMLFDIRMIRNYFGVDLADSLAVDVQILIHTLDENTRGGLKDAGERYLDADSKEEQSVLKAHLKSVGAGAKEFYKADKAILAKYGAKDAKLTYDLAVLKLKELKEQGLEELFFGEIMPVYREVLLPMVNKGIAVDIDKMKKSLLEITRDIKVFEDSILQKIAPLLQKFEDWYLDKTYPLKSRGLVYNKMKEGLDLRSAQKAVAAEKDDAETFNLQSKNHLKFLFFNILKLKPISFTEFGSPQVDETFLEEAAKTLDWVQDLIIFNKLNKIKSTYIERILNEQEDGIFYPEYFLHRTVSGRMSGDFQQLPRPLESGNELLMKYTNQIRTFFIARPGMVFIDDDYDSLEPRVFAAVAGDEALTDIFKKGHDFYSTIAIMVEGLQNVSADKKADNYLGKVNKTARQTAKAYSLGIAYGLDGYKLHKDLNIPQNVAESLVAKYFKAFPKLHKWQQDTKERILQHGEIATRFGRKRRNPLIPEIYTKHGPCILSMLEVWKKYNEAPSAYAEAKKDYKKVRHAINNAYNHQIQGLAGHILNRAAVAVSRAFRAEGLDAVIVGAIHDELLIECVETCKDRAATIVKNCMETTTLIETPLRAEPSFGYVYAEAKGV